MSKRGRRSSRGRRAPSWARTEDRAGRDDDVAMAQQATQVGRAGKTIPSAPMLAVQRTSGNAAATDLAMQMQRFSLKKTLKAAGGVVAGPYGRLAYEGVKHRRAKGRSPRSPRKGAYKSELFDREATKAELEKVASIVVQSVRSSKSLQQFHTRMLVDLKASTRMAVHRRLALLYLELYMQGSAKVRGLQQALQSASYLKDAKAPGPSAGDYVQGVFDRARDGLQDKTAPAKKDEEEQKRDPMERIAEALEALAGGKAAAGKGPTKAASSGQGATGQAPTPSSAGADTVKIPSGFFDEDGQDAAKAGKPSTARPGTKAGSKSRKGDDPTLTQATRGQLQGELKVRDEFDELYEAREKLRAEMLAEFDERKKKATGATSGK